MQKTGNKLVKEDLVDILQPRSAEDISTEWENFKQQAKEKIEILDRHDLWDFLQRFFYRWGTREVEGGKENTQLEEFMLYNLKHSQIRDLALTLLKDMNDYGFDDEDNYEFLNNFIKNNF